MFIPAGIRQFRHAMPSVLEDAETELTDLTRQLMAICISACSTWTSKSLTTNSTHRVYASDPQLAETRGEWECRHVSSGSLSCWNM